MFDISKRTIFVTLAGSQAHGTARSDSDLDLRGVCVAPLAVRLSLFRNFEQTELPLTGELAEGVRSRLERRVASSHDREQRTETVIFEIAKFVGLCTAGNPNALEILFADERDWLFETPAWRAIWSQRQRFLSRRVQQTFLGYGLAQLKRIRTHRSWLLNPLQKKPARSDFGLPDASTLSSDDQSRIEAAIEKKLQSYGIDDIEMPKSTRMAVEHRLTEFWRDSLACSEPDLSSTLRGVAIQTLSIPADVASALNAEKQYRAAMKQWESYQVWRVERNPKRAELERRHGYDTKHAMHLVRLMRMGLEVLETGELRVRRPDADELNAIRDGALSYDDLITVAMELQARMQAAAPTSSLPDDVDHDWADRVALEASLAMR